MSRSRKLTQGEIARKLIASPLIGETVKKPKRKPKRKQVIKRIYAALAKALAGRIKKALRK